MCVCACGGARAHERQLAAFVAYTSTPTCSIRSLTLTDAQIPSSTTTAPDGSIVEGGEACTFKISREIEDDTGLGLAAIIVVVVAAVLVVGFAFLARFYKNKLYYALMKKEIEASGLVVVEAKSNGALASENSKL